MPGRNNANLRKRWEAALNRKNIQKEEYGYITQKKILEILETQEINLDTAEIGDLPEGIIETTDKETKGVRKKKS